MVSQSFYFVQLHPGPDVNSVFNFLCVVMFIKPVIVDCVMKNHDTDSSSSAFLRILQCFRSVRKENGDINLGSDPYPSYFAHTIFKNKIFCPCITLGSSNF